MEKAANIFHVRYRILKKTTGSSPSTREATAKSAGNGAFTIRQFADDLYAFMRRRGIDKAHILGFSDGGNIALTFVLRLSCVCRPADFKWCESVFFGNVRCCMHSCVSAVSFLADVPKRSERRGKNAELMGLMVNDPALKPEQLFQIRQKNTGHRRNERHDEEVPYRTDRAEYSQRGTEVSEGRSFIATKSRMSLTGKWNAF